LLEEMRQTPEVSMSLWKKIYFGVAFVAAIFLAVSLF